MPRSSTPALTVDCVVFDRKDRVLLIRRRFAPFKGLLALPGGFVERGETVEDACRRELFEETGLKVGRLCLIGVYSDPRRDPRGPTVSIAFLARSTSTQLSAGDDAQSAEWFAPAKSRPLAFDHADILADARRLARKQRRTSKNTAS